MTIDRPEDVRRQLALVMAGGAAGTTARYLLSEAIPDIAGVPTGILAINLTGAFLLGWLVAVLVRNLDRNGPETGTHGDLRALVGTGVLGGFTTYSALATDTVVLLRGGSRWLGLAYGLGTVVVGVIATIAGIAVGRRVPWVRGARA